MSILLVLLLITACDTTSVTQRSAQAIAEAPASLPSFSDWRVAYLGADSHLRIVTLDGRIMISGPKLSGVMINGLRIASAGFSRNGHLFAYSGKNGIQVLDVSGRQNTNHVASVAAAEVAWSPDGTELALGDGQGNVGIAHVVNGTYRAMPSQRDHILNSILGWVDSIHLAVTLVPPPTAAIPSAPRTALGILNISTWSLHTVATFSSADMGVPEFVLSPDGKYALYFNREFRNDPYTATVSEIELSTGTVTALPRLAGVMGPYSGFTSLAWRTGTQTVAASTGFDTNGDLKTWLLDLRHDSAVRLRLPKARYVAGWEPGGDMLILSTGWQILANGGPYEISAAKIGASGSISATMLTQEAMTFPVVGFVRTA